MQSHLMQRVCSLMNACNHEMQTNYKFQPQFGPLALEQETKEKESQKLLIVFCCGRTYSRNEEIFGEGNLPPYVHRKQSLLINVVRREEKQR